MARPEKVAVVESLRSFRHGGDRRSDRTRTRDVEPLTVDLLAKRVGLGGKDGFLRAKAVVERGVPELVEAMVDVWKTLKLKFVEAEIVPLHRLAPKPVDDARCTYPDMKKAAE